MDGHWSGYNGCLGIRAGTDASDRRLGRGALFQPVLLLCRTDKAI